MPTTDSPQTEPTEPKRYCVKNGSARGAEVFYQPRSESDGFPWVVHSRWYSEYNGWRYAPQSVTTVERYRAAGHRR